MSKEEIVTRLQHVLKHAHHALTRANTFSEEYADAYPVELEVRYILDELKKELAR